MIGFIKGYIRIIDKDYIVVENNGIGYKVYFSKFDKIKMDIEVMLYTHTHVREDDISLYGFLTKAEYDLFMKLISVKGLGCKIANGIIAFKPYEQIVDAIANGDLPFIKSFPGVGSKTASQIILDLKGKLVAEDNNKEKESEVVVAVTEALKNLGFKASEITPVIKSLDYNHLSEQELLKTCLSKLYSKR